MPPNNGDVERRLTVLETKLEVVLPGLATKTDIAKMQLQLVVWLVATGIAVVGALIGYLNLTRATPAAQVQPVVIQMPATTTPPSQPPMLQSPK